MICYSELMKDLENLELLENQLKINRKINKKLPPELRLPETEKEFVQRELEILSDQLDVVKDTSLIANMKERKHRLLDYLQKLNA